MLADSRAVLVLGVSEVLDELPAGRVRMVALDDALVRVQLSMQEESPLEVAALPDALAYVMYTSGSSGRPKGVAVTHGGLATYVGWAVRAYTTEGGAPVHSSLGFDLTVTSVWVPLVAGAPVRMSVEGGAEGLAALLGESAFGLVKVVPGHLALLSELVPAEVLADAARTWVVGGRGVERGGCPSRRPRRGERVWPDGDGGGLLHLRSAARRRGRGPGAGGSPVAGDAPVRAGQQVGAGAGGRGGGALHRRRPSCAGGMWVVLG
ncbi:hypothetical protein GCM10020001_120010 [Nonomuraea salmonea]